MIIIEIKCAISVMCSNHPQTIPILTPSVEKLSSTKPVPSVKKVRDCYLRGQRSKKYEPLSSDPRHLEDSYQTAQGLEAGGETTTQWLRAYVQVQVPV